MRALAVALSWVLVLQARATTIGPQAPLVPFKSYALTGDFVAAGVGLRDVGSGSISVALPTGALVVQAFLYWSIIAPEEPALSASLNGHPISGTLLAQVGDPCWPDLNTATAEPPTVFDWIVRADVTPFVVSGANTLAAVPSGLTGGEDPTDPASNRSAFPLADGASLVVVYSQQGAAQRSIVINDGGQTFFGDTLATTLGIAAPGATTPVSARTAYIVGDGQSFFPHDGALFNDVAVAGPGTAIRATDAFDGEDGGGPADANGLWDTLVVDVSPLVTPGDTSATAAVVSGDKLDCLAWVAQVLSVANAVPATTTTSTTSTTTATSTTTTTAAATTTTATTAATTSTTTSTTGASTSTTTTIPPTSTTTTTTAATTSTATTATTSTTATPTSTSTTTTRTTTTTAAGASTSTTATSTTTQVAASTTTTTSTGTTTTTCPSTCGSPLLGAASGCTILELDGANVTISGPGSGGGIVGDVCVGPKGALNLSGSQFVTGEIRLAPGATLTRSGSAHVGGVERNVDLSAQLLAAQTAANTATALSPGGCTQTFATLTTARPIVGQGSGQNVICVKGDLNLQAGRVLTLQGVAGETFLFDVAGQFALGGASRIVARGGLGPKDVLFNIIGAGKDVVLGGNSSVDGTILAPQRRVSLAPGFIAGALVTGRDINIGAGASAIKCPPCSGTITASVVVRLSRLIGTLNAAGDLGGLGPSLIAEVERAMARMERADQLFDGGRRAAGRAFLRRAVHDLRRFEHRVRSHAGRSAIPAATRRALLALAEPIRVDLLTLMESL